jgi:2-oxoglutarate ferredoxin oxidoreductase subunit delta
MKEKVFPVVNTKRCKGCGLCVAFCPKKVFQADFQGKSIVADPDACIGCMNCDYRCPDFAIVLVKEKQR